MEDEDSPNSRSTKQGEENSGRTLLRILVKMFWCHGLLHQVLGGLQRPLPKGINSDECLLLPLRGPERTAL